MQICPFSGACNARHWRCKDRQRNKIIKMWLRTWPTKSNLGEKKEVSFDITDSSSKKKPTNTHCGASSWIHRLIENLRARWARRKISPSLLFHKRGSRDPGSRGEEAGYAGLHFSLAARQKVGKGTWTFLAWWRLMLSHLKMFLAAGDQRLEPEKHFWHWRRITPVLCELLELLSFSQPTYPLPAALLFMATCF